MSESEAAALYRLMTWLSPSFPVGAFSYSSGIEWAVEAGDIADAPTLRDWLSAMLSDGAGFCDAVFLAQIHRAVTAHDDAALHAVAEIFYDPGFGVNVHHMIDRVCVERCISYANYEPATYQFQVRALPGTRFALLQGSDSGDMQTGGYRVKESDLPLYQIYPCGPSAYDLCGRWLAAGEINGAENYPYK